MVSFKAVSVLAKWPGFKFSFRVGFSVGISSSTDDVPFQTGFRGVSMSTRPVSESSCPERGSTPVSDLVVAKYGFRPSFKVRFQSRDGLRLNSGGLVSEVFPERFHSV